MVILAFLGMVLQIAVLIHLILHGFYSKGFDDYILKAKITYSVLLITLPANFILWASLLAKK